MLNRISLFLLLLIGLVIYQVENVNAGKGSDSQTNGSGKNPKLKRQVTFSEHRNQMISVRESSKDDINIGTLSTQSGQDTTKTPRRSMLPDWKFFDTFDQYSSVSPDSLLSEEEIQKISSVFVASKPAKDRRKHKTSKDKKEQIELGTPLENRRQKTTDETKHSRESKHVVNSDEVAKSEYKKHRDDKDKHQLVLYDVEKKTEKRRYKPIRATRVLSTQDIDFCSPALRKNYLKESEHPESSKDQHNPVVMVSTPPAESRRQKLLKEIRHSMPTDKEPSSSQNNPESSKEKPHAGVASEKKKERKEKRHSVVTDLKPSAGQRKQIAPEETRYTVAPASRPAPGEKLPNHSKVKRNLIADLDSSSDKNSLESSTGTSGSIGSTISSNVSLNFPKTAFKDVPLRPPKNNESWDSYKLFLLEHFDSAEFFKKYSEQAKR